MKLKNWAICILVTGLVFFADSANAFRLLGEANSSWQQVVRWDARGIFPPSAWPVQLYTSSDSPLPAGWEPVIDLAARRWQTNHPGVQYSGDSIELNEITTPPTPADGKNTVVQQNTGNSRLAYTLAHIILLSADCDTRDDTKPIENCPALLFDADIFIDVLPLSDCVDPQGAIRPGCDVTRTNWDLSTTAGQTVPAGSYSLYSTVLHEFGHLLGCGHSFDSNAVMRSSHLVAHTVSGLGGDDIDCVQHIYGGCGNGVREHLNRGTLSYDNDPSAVTFMVHQPVEQCDPGGRCFRYSDKFMKPDVGCDASNPNSCAGNDVGSDQYFCAPAGDSCCTAMCTERLNPGTTCEELPQDLCTDDICGAEGKCFHIPRFCTDGNACTDDPACLEGICPPSTNKPNGSLVSCVSSCYGSGAYQVCSNGQAQECIHPQQWCGNGNVDGCEDCDIGHSCSGLLADCDPDCQCRIHCSVSTAASMSPNPEQFGVPITSLRKVREEVFRGTVTGDEIIQVIEEHEGEINQILADNPVLLAEVQDLILEFGTLAERFFAGDVGATDFFLGKSLQDRLDSALHEFYKVASPELEHDLKHARNATKDLFFKSLKEAVFAINGNYGKKDAK